MGEIPYQEPRCLTWYFFWFFLLCLFSGVILFMLLASCVWFEDGKAFVQKSDSSCFLCHYNSSIVNRLCEECVACTAKSPDDPLVFSSPNVAIHDWKLQQLIILSTNRALKYKCFCVIITLNGCGHGFRVHFSSCVVLPSCTLTILQFNYNAANVLAFSIYVELV